MFENRKVIVVVPAYNEAKLIDRVLDTMPAIVDRVIVVDDASTDTTGELLLAARARVGPRLLVIRHERNGGVGAAIVTGYRAALPWPCCASSQSDRGAMEGLDARWL